ncbi:MAG: hypothetical protein H0X26_05395 [Alphaproteobacteria bacterium]|nr:hypothetical protein [Alphaproteobacteria bacterium]
MASALLLKALLELEALASLLEIDPDVECLLLVRLLEAAFEIEIDNAGLLFEVPAIEN